MMIMFQFIENIERIEWDIILLGAIFIFTIYLLTIILNIRITKGEFGITSGRFKAYCIAALFGVISNFADRLVYLYKVNWRISPVIKVVALIWVLCKLWKLSRYGDPRWYTGDEDSENKDPFSTTIGVSFCIMLAYTAPMAIAVSWGIIITLVQGLFELETYEYKRVIPMIMINLLEIVLSTCVSQWAYRLQFWTSIYVIALVGVICNIFLIAVNGRILDYITNDKYKIS